MIVNLKFGLHSSIDYVSVCNGCHDLYQELNTNQKIETYLKFHKSGKGKMICNQCGNKTKQ